MPGLRRLNGSDVGIDRQLLVGASDILTGSERMVSGNADLLTTFPLIFILSKLILRRLADDD